MPEVGGGTANDGAGSVPKFEDILDLLPLELVRSQLIPPAPNRRESAIDWLPEFGGASWIAYGASSLLVISHFPSPLSASEDLPDPFFQQVIEPPASEEPTDLTAVSWCPAQPSDGQVAAALGNRIFMYSPIPASESGSFSWKQTIGIVETFTIEAIRWTGSGDGLIAAGTEVVLWMRKRNSWEMSWKVRMEVPQALISTTWFAEGFVATAAGELAEDEITAEDFYSPLLEESKRVIVYHGDDKSGITNFHLCHPQPVMMIQWRPFTGTQLQKDISLSRRDILLTCCSDGTVRLWSEIDNGRPKKFNKDIHDQKSIRRLFNVVAVIEVNQSLKGTLGRNIFVKWAHDSRSVISKGQGDCYSLSSAYTDIQQIGKCEWVIGVGPNFCITFWAIHCLDDESPLRFPRVTMWNKRDVMHIKDSTCLHLHTSNMEGQSILLKAVASRSWPFGPPVLCSLLQLLPDNSISWVQLYNPSESSEDRPLNNISERSLSCTAGRVLGEHCHTGGIVDVAVHPYSGDIELAVSLDTNGLLLFWSLPSLSPSMMGVHAHIYPMWKVIGHIAPHMLSPARKFSCLVWAPSVLDENRFLLVGHEDGIDCFMIEVSSKGENILSHKMLTVPFNGQSTGRIFATPFEQLSLSSSFFLLCECKGTFKPLSWTVVFHVPGGNGGFSPSANTSAISEGRCVSSSGKFYHATFYGQSFDMSCPDSSGEVTTVAVVSPSNCILPMRDTSFSYFDYQIATGYSDGTVKLWGICPAQSEHYYGTEYVRCKLVGIFTAHQGPVTAVSLSSNCSKIATTSVCGPNNTTNLHIWQSVKLTSIGSFVLEDAIILKGTVIVLSWLAIGNGQIMLGICLPNELRVYSQKRSSGHSLHTNKSEESHLWYCIAVTSSLTILRGFLWGPKLTAVIVHENYISIYSHWLLGADRACNPNGSDVHDGRKQEDLLCSTTIDKEEKFNSGIVKKVYQHDYDRHTKSRLFSILDVSEKLDESLPLYHPAALIQYIYSGNWKRALVILKCFVECIRKNQTYATNLDSNKRGKVLHSIPQINLSTFFEDNNSVNSSSEGLFWGQSTTESNFDIQRNSFQFLDSKLGANMFDRISTNSDKYEVTDLADTLEKSHNIDNITELEKNEILVILDLLNDISVTGATSAYKSLDEAGRRFWVSVQFKYLSSIRKFGRMVAERPVVSSRLAAWAFQSDCQDDLLSSVLSAEPSWLEMRNLGVGLWYTNASQLRTRMEKMARMQYLKNKNPKDCALLYLALNRIQVLTGLFKISKDEKDKVLFGFLSRNFQDEKNKAAALKNAYVLMGRHQLELAIAFFLLGGDPSSAVTVCAKNLGDEQLALVICRLIEGYGGPLERQLISNILLPNALEKGDYWLSSLLDWTLGNYSQSVQRLISSNSVALGNNAAFSDPDIGRYCMILVTRNCFRCSVGEDVAAALSKLAAFFAASALNRCGLPLEALVCLSSSLSIEVKDRKNMSGVGDHEIFHGILNPFSIDACNWLLENVADGLESNTKLNMALRYISSFLRNHQIWSPNNTSKSCEVVVDYADHQDEELGQLKHDLSIIISLIDRKFSLKPVDLVNLILLFVHNSRSLFLGYLLLHVDDFLEGEDSCHNIGLIMDLGFVRLLFKATEEILCFLASFVVTFNFSNSMLKPVFYSNDQLHSSTFCSNNILDFLRILRLFFKNFQKTFISEDITSCFSFALDLIEIYLMFSSVCTHRNIEGLILTIHPILNGCANDESSFEVVSAKLRNILLRNSQFTVHGASSEVGCNSNTSFQEKELGATETPDTEEKGHLLVVSLWLHMLNFMRHGLSMFPREGCSNQSNMNKMITSHLSASAKMLIDSLTCVSSSLVKLVASLLRQKVLKGSCATSIVWLDECVRSNPSTLNHFLNQGVDFLQLPVNREQKSLKMLWDISISPADIFEYLAKEKVGCFPHSHQKQFGSWRYVQRNLSSENENHDSPSNREVENISANATYKETKSKHDTRVSENDGFPETKKHSDPKRDITYFCNPKEVMRRSGELFEAVCFNSINENEVAIASNKKGLVFFNMKAEEHSMEQADYIWSDSDWPQDGWAGCESTPVPTYVSQGIGLGSKRGAHLGLGGATIGVGFGISGYAGIGASSLGWGEEEDFEVFRDPPATVENIHSRALSRHPSMPFLLVGSSNTHVYLWEFGKDKATATYGVLPAANVPPPYALASISAVQFDHYGHRFATTALDGTVCTWQLEVGGRSNVHPTDSSLCFSNHAADVAYVATSGSILAAAGSSTNGVNVVLWDTLAPPATYQASLFCHEGGARSISVLDNDIGTGSVSPIIITGGKGGDVGLHDLRYIATGKTRRNRHANDQDLRVMHNQGTPKHGENSNRMIWDIPKAHSGSVTSITAIPNTSLFLTGGKDGDVKLWDAKHSRLVFHWQKLHDRHTFLQPNSRGFGGVVRAAVTDIQVLSHGFLTCGGDGSVKLVQLK